MSELLQEMTLTELLEPADFTRLGNTLTILLGTAVAFANSQRKPLWGMADPHAGSQPLMVELEPLGYLLAAAETSKLAAAAMLVNTLLVARWGYLSSSRLHDVVVDEDFEALQASEARYKALASELEQRVETQLALLQSRQRQLYESERFAAIGQLAAGVAHEINTPIGFMRSNLNTLAHYLDTLEQLKTRKEALSGLWEQHDLDYVLEDSRDLLRDCCAGIERIAGIVRDLRGFSCVDMPEMEFIDPAECLRRAIAMTNMQKPATVNLHCDIAPLPLRACQSGLLSQAFLNILRNAVQAVESGGDIVVNARADATGTEITIRDNGSGIAPEMLPHVFEPFFTTRPVGSGTGLGLSVARDAIEAHGGEIRLASTPGQGTLVTIRWPS